MSRLFFAAALAFSLAACGPEKVPQNVVDNNMTVSRHNAQKNADAFLAMQFPAGTVESTTREAPIMARMDSDSTISADCRYGDGWASGKVIFPSGKSAKLICQTNGSGKGQNGCLWAADFHSKPYANEEKTCQRTITELPKF